MPNERLLRRRAPRLLALLLVLGGALAAPAAAQSERVDALFARWDRPGSPGCAVAVVKDGALVHRKGYGSANLDYEIPITPTSVFYAASVSKQFTAAVIALLAQQGRLSLDDDVRKYVPELPDYGKTVTIRHLIHHTSGLRDYLSLMGLAGMRTADVWSDQEVLDLIARQKGVNFVPGAEHLYNNTGYFLVSVIVPRVTGQSLRQFAQEQIFGPLGMRNTHFHDDRNQVVRNRAHSYAATEGGGYELDYWANFEKVGSGGLLTTVEDLALWDANFYSGSVGGPAFLETMHTRGVLSGGDTLEYAFGNEIGSYRGLKTVEHGGSSMGFRAHLLRFPEQRFSSILLCNVAGTEPAALARRIADVYLEGRFTEPVPPPRSAPAAPTGHAAAAAAANRAEYAGVYHSDEVGLDYRVVAERGGLVLKRRAAADAPLVPTGPDTFRAGSLVLKFTRDAQGRPAGFVVDAGRTRNLRFTRS